MKMQFLVLGCLLTTSIFQTVLSLSPNPAMGAEPQTHGAAQLMSSPEMMECSLERSRALWQFPNPARLGNVPCQFLNSVGGPEEGDALIFNPAQLESASNSIGLEFPHKTQSSITQPLDAFAPVHTTRGQWVDLSSTSLREESTQWLRDLF